MLVHHEFPDKTVVAAIPGHVIVVVTFHTVPAPAEQGRGTLATVTAATIVAALFLVAIGETGADVAGRKTDCRPFEQAGTDLGLAAAGEVLTPLPAPELLFTRPVLVPTHAQHLAFLALVANNVPYFSFFDVSRVCFAAVVGYICRLGISFIRVVDFFDFHGCRVVKVDGKVRGQVRSFRKEGRVEEVFTAYVDRLEICDHIGRSQPVVDGGRVGAVATGNGRDSSQANQDKGEGSRHEMYSPVSRGAASSR